MYYTVYQITNTINGMIYVGVHQTANLNDGYMGSGKYIKAAQEKYDVGNFTKEILHYCDTSDAMFAKEAEIVTESFIQRDDVYNLKTGGAGGFNFSTDEHAEYGRLGAKATNKMMMEKYGTDWKVKTTQKARDGRTYETYHKMNNTMIDRHGIPFNQCFKGKTHSETTKQNMRDTRKGTGTGSKNSQFGSCWVQSLDLKKSKKIKQHELTTYINDGWIKGRKMKFD